MSTSVDFDRMVLSFMSDDPLTVTYQSKTQTYSDATGMMTTETVSIPCQAILLEVDPRKFSGDGTKEGTLIRQGDKLLFLRPPEKVDPYRLPLVVNTASDTILVGATQYNIVTSKQTNPSAANCILYEIYLRN